MIGAGIAGLTSAAILSKLGLSVTLIESHKQSGGCAGTFKRNKYIFDVGATQVAGFEIDGIHSRIFNFLKIPIPEAEILNPSCVVDLNDGYKPINIWYEQDKWSDERLMHFPNSQNFWSLCALIHLNNWKFANNNPILPIRNLWDFSQLVQALSLPNLFTGILIKASMFDLLKLCGVNKDERLIKFLNLQLKLYSQEDVYKTAALYGCTVLQMSQQPHGLWHLKRSMQELSHSLETSLMESKGNIFFGEKVNSLKFNSRNKMWTIAGKKGNKNFEYQAHDVIYTAPPQGLLSHLDDSNTINQIYLNKLKRLPNPCGALVFYSALKRENISNNFSNHYQFSHKGLGSLFLSLSKEGDGRAPKGELTLIASMFTNTNDWINLTKIRYKEKKEEFFEKISLAIENQLNIHPSHWLHRELATPSSFEKWTNRPKGIVGGLGQSPEQFGIFGLASRTPLDGLWLCGDSIYPGEGTAGVSQSALMVVRQILSNNGMKNFSL